VVRLGGFVSRAQNRLRSLEVGRGHMCIISTPASLLETAIDLGWPACGGEEEVYGQCTGFALTLHVARVVS
jgi:hypothetical protein